MTEEQTNRISDLEAQVAAQSKMIEAQKAVITELEAKIAALPAASTTSVVEDSKSKEPTEKNEVEAFVDTFNSARKLFNEV